VRHVLRRATREGHDADDVLSAYEAFLFHWPADRRDAALAAVEAGMRDATATGLMRGLQVSTRPAPCWLVLLPARLSGDGIEGVA
jgi:hypothetical protein